MTAAEIGALMADDRPAARAPLDQALQSLHGSGKSHELCALHCLAAQYWSDDPAQAAFHHTHAYIYALEAGDDQVESMLFDTLSKQGRI